MGVVAFVHEPCYKLCEPRALGLALGQKCPWKSPLHHCPHRETDHVGHSGERKLW